MNYVPGQFVYIGFGRDGYKKETHPFSIVSVPCDGHLEVWIKPVGDFTTDLGEIQEGHTATIYGPYGTLYEKIFGKESVICIAGGIGITPFVGLIRQFALQIPSTVFHLFYSVKSRADAEELALDNRIISEHSNALYHLTATESDPRLTGKDIMEIVSHTEKSMYLLCGPMQMMKSIKVQLLEAGVHPRMIFYEEFQY
jgi:predicted ferric reductase